MSEDDVEEAAVDELWVEFCSTLIASELFFITTIYQFCLRNLTFSIMNLLAIHNAV